MPASFLKVNLKSTSTGVWLDTRKVPEYSFRQELQVRTRLVRFLLLFFCFWWKKFSQRFSLINTAEDATPFDCAQDRLLHPTKQMPNTLADWLIYLESLHPKTIALGLERVAQVKQRLNLQPDFPVIVVGTLAAMQCFIEHKVDVAILEVGLGGRLDAVNVFDNDCAVIASVDIDHTDYLGDTREQIAFEKAGIFRSGKVAICADSDVPQAIRAQAQKVGAELWCIGAEFGFQQMHEQWNFRSKLGSRNALPYPALRGAFQLHNASAALAALDVLKERLPVSMEAVRRGFGEVQLAGRFQFVPGKPTLILDVAHNPHAARSLAQNLAGLPPCPNTYAVFAMLKDKDMAGVVAALDPHIDTWLAAGIDTPRGATPEKLEQVLQQCQVRGEIKICKNISAALRYAYNAC